MPDKRKLVIFGNTEYAKMVCDYFEEFSNYEVCAFTVNQNYRKDDIFYSKKNVDFETIEKTYSPNDYDMFIAVGSSQLNKVRERIFNAAKDKGYHFATFVHPHAYVASKVSVGENCIIMECARILRGTTLANNIIVWPSAFISHDNIIKNNAYIVGSTNGFCTIGENCFLGAGAMIADHINVARDNFITMSSVIRKDTEPNSIYEGFPAQKRRGITACDFFNLQHKI